MMTGYQLRWALVLGVLALSGVAISALTSTSVAPTSGARFDSRFEIRQYRCDNSAAISGEGPSGGETCATGNWWPAVNAHGARTVTLSGLEYGTGSGEWGLFNCQDPVGSGPGQLATVGVPGVEDPSSAPSAADPDPLCTRINVDAGGATVPLNGVGTQEIHFSGEARTFGYLVVRTDNCTGDCDASIALEVVW